MLTVGFNLLLRSNLNADANRVLDASASAALEGISEQGGKPHVKEGPDPGAPDTRVWVYSGKTSVERPPAPPSVQQLADTLAGGPKTHAEDAIPTSLLAVPVTQGGRGSGRSSRPSPWSHTSTRPRRRSTGSLIYAGVAFLLVLIATRVIVTRALRPVARMTAEAADWSEHDLDHRFNVGEPHDELTQLAATFDDMLARIASALRHEQLLSAELSHELRTPLAAVVTEAELALRRDRGTEEYRDALREIASRSAQMQRILETLMAAARAESIGERGTAEAGRLERRRSRHAPESRTTRAWIFASRRPMSAEGRCRRRYCCAHCRPVDRERL